MLGFATLGKFALGQVGPPSVIVPGVSATGVAGVISASEGAVPRVGIPKPGQIALSAAARCSITPGQSRVARAAEHPDGGSLLDHRL